MAERTVKHGLFTYYEEIDDIMPDGSQGTRLVERIAFHGETVDIPRKYDLARGDKHGAFYTEEELEERADLAAGVQPEDLPLEEDEDVPLEELEDTELVEWLQGTGMFDGEDKPTAREVVDAADDDPELAARLLVAEKTASGGQPRKEAESGLQKVIDEE